ncbi:MAG: hypothetical protein ACYCSR_03705 [Thiomonas sp.]|uniref:Uncharacterized protein n=1 Tax=mine drainage metagenome TaxID=410659 RepID=E6PJZ0_9ZZZZ
MPRYVPDPKNPGQVIDIIKLLRGDPLTPPPVHIDGLLKRDLWTRQEALLILAGLDPCNVVHGGYPIGSIGAGIRYLDGTASAQLDAQGLQHPRAQDWLPEFDRLKGYAAGHDMNERKAPSEWIAWAESKDFTPYWRAEPQPAPAGDTCIEGEDAAEFIECANNGGEPIDWRNWVGNRPVLKAGDAARLMAGLEPTLHKSLEIARNESAGDAKQRARKFEEWAASQGMEHASPADWLTWGQSQGEAVHVGFRLAVEQYAAPAGQAATESTQPGGLKTDDIASAFSSIFAMPRFLAYRKGLSDSKHGICRGSTGGGRGRGNQRIHNPVLVATYLRHKGAPIDKLNKAFQEEQCLEPWRAQWKEKTPGWDIG